MHEPFVVVDIGVQGGENIRWHLLGDHLEVYGFDAIREVAESLTKQNARNPKKKYFWIAAGNVDEERPFYFNAADPFSSSVYQQAVDRFQPPDARREQARTVTVRRLDTLLAQGVIRPADFIKVDVEGFEQDVLMGASELLKSVLGAELETNFGISPIYPGGHIFRLQELLLPHHLLVFDLNYNRVPRATFQNALETAGLERIVDPDSAGKPATVNVLFCRDLIDDTDHPENYVTRSETPTLDQILKMMIIYELHGLNDIAVDTAMRFSDVLGSRVDPEKIVDLLIERYRGVRTVVPSSVPRKVYDLRRAFALSRQGRWWASFRRNTRGV